MEFKKENLLHLALAIPVLMIVITIVGVFFFQVQLHPKYNFIYAELSTPTDYACQLQLEYKLHPDSLAKNVKLSGKVATQDCSKTEIYLYDFSKKTSTKLTLEEAENYVLTSQYSQPSPDGFTIQPYCSSGGNMGWWNPGMGGYGVCLRKDNDQQRLNLAEKPKVGTSFHRFYFLGWILSEKKHQK